jgi:RHS repeat-associated protein
MTNGAGSWLFSYDGDGKRVSHLVTEGSSSSLTQYFMSGGYEVTSDTVAGTSTFKKYYALAGSTYAMSNNGVMQYLLTDHLGSVVAVTDNLGTLLEDSRYMPFGSVRSDVGSVTQTDKSFTGQKSLANTGLMDYNARMYSPLLGRFIQPDTIVPGAGNSQSWNRMSYVVNNPVRLVDPTGHITCEEKENGICVQNSDATAGGQKLKAGSVQERINQFSNVIVDKKFSYDEKKKLLETLEKISVAHGGISEFAKDLGLFIILNLNITGVYGMVPPIAGRNVVILSDSIFSASDYMHYIAHEIGHVFDFNSGARYKSDSFITAFSPNTCPISSIVGCVAPENSSNLKDQNYINAAESYRKLSWDYGRNSYNPSSQPAREYGYVSTIEDFADTYAIVTLGASTEFPQVDLQRQSIMEVWINQ